MRENSKPSSPLAIVLQIKNDIIERIANLFARWAAFAYDYPYWCIGGTLVFTLLTCIGFIPGIPTWIDGADPLYSLPYSVARSQGAVYRVLFNETAARPSFVLVTGKVPGENIFTWEHLKAVQQLDRLIRGQIVDPKHGRRIGVARQPEYDDYDDEILEQRQQSNHVVRDIEVVDPEAPEEARRVIELINNASKVSSPETNRGDAGRDILTFQDICARNSFGECSVTSILEMGIFDVRTTLLEEDDPPVIYLFDGLAFNAQKRGFPPHYLLARANEIPCSPELPTSLLTLFYNEADLMPGSSAVTSRANMTCITHVEGFQLIYEVSDKEKYLQRNEDWEKILVEVLQDNMNFGLLSVTMNAFRSRDDALRSSTSESSDILFVALTFGLLIWYSTTLNFSCDLYRSKSYPAVCGVIAAMLGLIAGMGVVSLCGVAFVPTALVCPFLVVGVGVDDMFVIINSYTLAYMVDSARDRCILSLRETGLAITITTVTSLVSFSIGLNTGYLSIRNFCFFCGAGMFFGYIFVLTFFFPITCLDGRREEENKACFFRIPRNKRRESRRQELRNEGVYFGHTAEISIFALAALMVRRAEQKALQKYCLAKARRLELPLPTELDAISDPSQHKSSASCNDPNDSRRLVPKPGRFGELASRVRSNMNSLSDYLLSLVALEGHRVALERGFTSPDQGALLFDHLDPSKTWAGDVEKDIIHHPNIPLHYTSELTGQKKLFICEPRGSVGLKWRKFLIKFYGPLIVHRYAKIAVLTIFTVILGVAMYGCTQLDSGLDLRDLAPAGSYLNQFDNIQAEFFNEYDFPVDVFFPERMDWWDLKTQSTLREFQAILEVSGSGKLVVNPVIRMLDDPELKPALQSGNQELFEQTLFRELSLEGGKYKQFEQNFLWEGSTLRAWKMQILPAAMQSSTERAVWMTQIREDCNAQLRREDPMLIMAWNYMMTFYESDLQITSSVTSNMIVAAVTMLLVAMIGIPQFQAGVIVIFIMGMIDICIVGFMYFWGVKLNMVSMICLLIAVGFSVDFTAHVCHTFMDAEGQTRNQRTIESLVLMGNPVFHGAASSILGVLMLGFSQSYIFQVFFKMMTLVTVLALSHSVLFLPVLLSLVGSSLPHSARKHGLPIDGKGHSPLKGPNSGSTPALPAERKNLSQRLQWSQVDASGGPLPSKSPTSDATALSPASIQTPYYKDECERGRGQSDDSSYQDEGSGRSTRQRKLGKRSRYLEEEESFKRDWDRDSELGGNAGHNTHVARRTPMRPRGRTSNRSPQRPSSSMGERTRGMLSRVLFFRRNQGSLQQPSNNSNVGTGSIRAHARVPGAVQTGTKKNPMDRRSRGLEEDQDGFGIAVGPNCSSSDPNLHPLSRVDARHSATPPSGVAGAPELNRYPLRHQRNRRYNKQGSPYRVGCRVELGAASSPMGWRSQRPDVKSTKGQTSSEYYRDRPDGRCTSSGNRGGRRRKVVLEESICASAIPDVLLSSQADRRRFRAAPEQTRLAKKGSSWAVHPNDDWRRRESKRIVKSSQGKERRQSEQPEHAYETERRKHGKSLADCRGSRARSCDPGAVFDERDMWVQRYSERTAEETTTGSRQQSDISKSSRHLPRSNDSRRHSYMKEQKIREPSSPLPRLKRKPGNNHGCTPRTSSYEAQDVNYRNDRRGQVQKRDWLSNENDLDNGPNELQVDHEAGSHCSYPGMRDPCGTLDAMEDYRWARLHDHGCMKDSRGRPSTPGVPTSEACSSLVVSSTPQRWSIRSTPQRSSASSSTSFGSACITSASMSISPSGRSISLYHDRSISDRHRAGRNGGGIASEVGHGRSREVEASVRRPHHQSEKLESDAYETRYLGSREYRASDSMGHQEREFEQSYSSTISALESPPRRWISPAVRRKGCVKGEPDYSDAARSVTSSYYQVHFGVPVLPWPENSILSDGTPTLKERTRKVGAFPDSDLSPPIGGTEAKV